MKIDIDVWLNAIKNMSSDVTNKIKNSKIASSANEVSDKIRKSKFVNDTITTANTAFDEGKKTIKPKNNKILAGVAGGAGLTAGVAGSEMMDEDMDSGMQGVFANLTPEERRIVSSIMANAGSRQ